jgi:hypothetical protein
MRLARRRLLAAAGLAVLGLAALPAQAFRPSSTWVLGRAMEKARDRGTTSLRADATTSAWDVTGKAVIEGAAERVWLEAPGRLRRELDVGKDTTVEVRADGRLLVRQPGKPEQSLKSGLDLLADVMTTTSTPRWCRTRASTAASPTSSAASRGRPTSRSCGSTRTSLCRCAS